MKVKKELENPIEVQQAFQQQKKRKFDLIFSRRFYLPKLSVEKARENSSCGSSSCFSSSKTCLFSWCDAAFSSFNGNPF
jgi:hypothetical protein